MSVIADNSYQMFRVTIIKESVVGHCIVYAGRLLSVNRDKHVNTVNWAMSNVPTISEQNVSSFRQPPSWPLRTPIIWYSHWFTLTHTLCNWYRSDISMTSMYCRATYHEMYYTNQWILKFNVHVYGWVWPKDFKKKNIFFCWILLNFNGENFKCQCISLSREVNLVLIGRIQNR